MNLEASLQSLRNVLSAIGEISNEQWNKMAAIWQPFAAKRKELLTCESEVERYAYFVIDGVQRVYHFDEQNREATIVFSYAPSFGGVIDSMLLQIPSAYFYETLTASTFLRAKATDLLALMEQDAGLAQLMYKGVTHALSGIMERMVELQCYSSEDKFRKLLSRSPHILTLVPHKYLANYLGIDATNFSKLVNKVRI